MVCTANLKENYDSQNSSPIKLLILRSVVSPQVLCRFFFFDFHFIRTGGILGGIARVGFPHRESSLRTPLIIRTVDQVGVVLLIDTYHHNTRLLIIIIIILSFFRTSLDCSNFKLKHSIICI